MENDAYQRYLQGDDSALLDLIREYRGGLIMYINSYVRDMNTADELCNETFVKLAVKKPEFRGNSSFKTFLYSIGRNTALDYLKHSKKHQTRPIEEVLEISSQISVEKEYLIKEQNRAVYEAMSRLKPEYSQVLWLTYFEDFSNKETAAVMKKSLAAVESLLHRAKPALRRELEKEGFVYDD